MYRSTGNFKVTQIDYTMSDGNIATEYIVNWLEWNTFQLTYFIFNTVRNMSGCKVQWRQKYTCIVWHLSFCFTIISTNFVDVKFCFNMRSGQHYVPNARWSHINRASSSASNPASNFASKITRHLAVSILRWHETRTEEVRECVSPEFSVNKTKLEVGPAFKFAKDVNDNL